MDTRYVWNMINALANKEYGNIHTIGNEFYYVIGNSELPDFGANNGEQSTHR